MRIDVTSRQEAHDISEEKAVRLVAFFMERASAMDPTRNWVDCSLVLMDDAGMADLNQSALDHEGPTDVITFTYPTQPGEPEGYRGEVVVNAELAHRLGTTMTGGPDRELALYIAHGCQHLGGADDRTESEREAMDQRQNRWLREAEREGLIGGLFEDK